MISADWVKLIAVCFIFGFGFLYQAIRKQKRIRQIEDTPKSKIATAAQGLVEVQGFAWPMNKIYPGAGGFDLVYYRFSLERKETRGSGKHRRTEWVTIYTFTHNDPFYLLDPTGLAVVDASTSEMEIGTERTRYWHSLTPNEKTHYLEKIIPKNIPNFPPKAVLFGLVAHGHRIVEKEIRSGCPVYVTGDFRSHDMEKKKITTEGLTHFANRVIDFNSRAFKNLNALLDKDSDGKVCYKEARDGYSFAAQLSKKKTQMDQLPENEFEIFGIFRSNQNHNVFIADAHENHLVQKMKAWQWLRVLGGSGLVTAGIVMTIRLFVSDAAIEQAMHKKPTVEQRVPSSKDGKSPQR